MAFSFHLHSSQRYSSLCSEIEYSTKIYHKIKNISGNIGVMLLKHGTSNVPTFLLSRLFYARLTFSFFV